MNSPHQFHASIEIQASTQVAYQLWSDCENFPKFMRGVREVRRLDERRLHWRAEISGEYTEWDAEIVEDIPGELISWRTTTGHPAAGLVSFVDLGPDRMRVVHKLALQAVDDDSDVSAIDEGLTQDLERFRDLVEGRNARP